MTDKQIVVSISVFGVLALVIGMVVVTRPVTQATVSVISSPPAVVGETPVASTSVPMTANLEIVPATVAQPVLKFVQPVVAVAPQPVAPKPARPAVTVPPKAFRGVNWGEDLTSRNDMSLASYQQDTASLTLSNDNQITIPELHVKNYIRTNEKNQFGTETVGEIDYKTCDGHFFEVNISNPNPFALSTIFSQVYGPANETKVLETTYWNWTADNGQTDIGMSYSSPSESFPNGFSYAHITNAKLSEQLKAQQEAEAKIELNKAKKDF